MKAIYCFRTLCTELDLQNLMKSQLMFYFCDLSLCLFLSGCFYAVRSFKYYTILKALLCSRGHSIRAYLDTFSITVMKNVQIVPKLLILVRKKWLPLKFA